MVGLLIPKKSAIFTGTGDLFTAVYLAWSEHGVKVCISVVYIMPVCVYVVCVCTCVCVYVCVCSCVYMCVYVCVYVCVCVCVMCT